MCIVIIYSKRSRKRIRHGKYSIPYRTILTTHNDPSFALGITVQPGEWVINSVKIEE